MAFTCTRRDKDLTCIIKKFNVADFQRKHKGKIYTECKYWLKYHQRIFSRKNGKHTR